MGGGLAAPARGASPGRGAPDGAELLPRQAVGARDAAAQDAATDSLRAPGVAPGGVDVRGEAAFGSSVFRVAAKVPVFIL